MTATAIPDVVIDEVTPRDVKISIARQAIESCLLDDDQIAPGHETPFVDSTVVVFTVACPTWERGQDLELEAVKALAAANLGAYTRRSITREIGTDNSAVVVEIRVVVGADDRKPAGAP